MNTILQIDNLNKSYGTKAVLHDVSFSLPSGKIVGLLGPNGSGKTTLIKIVNTLITDFSGTVRVCGGELGVETKHQISYLPDTTYLSPWMRIRTCIKMFDDFYANFDAVKAFNMCRDLGLDENARVSTLSKGMCEKLQLLLVMSRKVSLYIFDEPLAGVDPAARDFIVNTILTNYHEEGSIFLSTHLITDIEQILDHALFLKEGRIVLDEAVDNVREQTGRTLDEHFREVFRN